MDARSARRYAAPVLVLVVGDANADLCGTLATFPHEGDDCPLESLALRSGGSSTNTAAALARLGVPARLLARVGVDPAADVALAAARTAGVDLALVERDEALATGLCFAAISASGERTFLSYRGANTALAARDPGRALAGATHVHVGGHALIEGAQRRAALAVLDEAARRGLPCSVDLCLPLLRADAPLVHHLASRLDVVFANDREAALLGDARGGAAVLVEKLGARGARVTTATERLEVPAFPVEARDTTGAGDAFAAGFLLARARGASLATSAVVAAAVGAIATTRVGAAEALPTADELARFLDERGAPSAAAVVRLRA